jgi:hypothetical protein
VHNEATDLEPRLRRLHAHLSALPFPFGPPRTGPGGLFVGLPIPSTKSMGTLTRPSQPSPAVTKLLDRDASSYTWVAATVGAERAAGFQLAGGHPVLPLGGQRQRPGP